MASSRPGGILARRAGQGQSLLEYAMLTAAVATAVLIMSDYFRRAFNAHAETIEEGLNGATDDNKP